MSLFKYNLQPRTKSPYKLTLPSFTLTLPYPLVNVKKISS